MSQLLSFQQAPLYKKLIKLPYKNISIPFRDLGHLYLWARYFEEENSNFIMAAVGRPTAPLNVHIKKGLSLYADGLSDVRAIEYGDLQGEKEYRKRMATALSIHYCVPLEPQNVLFTVGGRMGLAAISYAIKKISFGKKIVTTVPYYPDHLGLFEDNCRLETVLVDTLHSGLTAIKLMQALQNKDPEQIGAFIFCVPNNPMGWIISCEEWLQIAEVLMRYPLAPIIIDEAYIEMVFKEGYQSLLTLCPQLRERLIILRSATKGLSASGERMAIIITTNSKYMYFMKEYHFTHLIHAPKSSQFAYSYAMENLDHKQFVARADFYQRQVRHVEKILKLEKLHFNNEPIASTFYATTDMSHIIGSKMSDKAKAVYPNNKEHIEDDIDIAFHLMATYGLALMPLSLFGVEPQRGLMRITCSLTQVEIMLFQDIIKEIGSLMI